MKATSKSPVTVGLILNLYSDLWQGARPGIAVSDGKNNEAGQQVATFQVFLNGSIDQDAISKFSAEGLYNTLADVRVYDKDAGPGATESNDLRYGTWAEWPTGFRHLTKTDTPNGQAVHVQKTNPIQYQEKPKTDGDQPAQ